MAKIKKYIIVGDNNFWYSTINAKNKTEALKELNRIARVIKRGVGSEFDEPSEASELYLYEAVFCEKCGLDVSE